MSIRMDLMTNKPGKKGRLKEFADAFDRWDKKHLTPPGKKVKSSAKQGKMYLLPKSTGDAKAWKDYMAHPKRYEIRLPKAFK